MARRVISIITPHYSPEITAAAHRMEIAARTLSASYKVHVFTLAEKGSRKDNYDIKHDANLTVHYLAQRNFNKSSFIIRVFFEIWYSIKLVLKSNSVESDLVLVTIPFMFLLPVTTMLSNASKKVADVRDLVWHYLPSNSLFRRMVRKFLRAKMHRSLHKFDAITLTNEAEKKWLIRNGFDDSDLIVIPNGLSLDKYRQLRDIRQTTHSQKFIITYVGNVGSSQHFYGIINAVSDMKDVKLYIIGDGNDFKTLQSYVNSKKITNVNLLGKMKWAKIFPFYQTSNLLFASLKENFNTAIPSKLYEYLATGLPVLFQGRGAASDLLMNYENTYIVDQDDTTDLEKVIWKIKNSNTARSPKNTRDIGRNFIREKLSCRFVELSARILNERTLSDVYIDDVLEEISE
jgi:glycosyltransferase involved in cell wall biosynthesis